MAQSIKISDENYRNICKVSKQERRTKKTVIDKALENYFKKGLKNGND